MNQSNTAPTVGKRLKQAGVACVATVLPFAALAQDATTDIVGAVNEGKANAIIVATAVVVAAWAITAIYMMRRKS